MARKLIVEIIGDSKSYERALGRSTKASKNFSTSLTGMTRSASLGFGTIVKGAAAFVGVSSAFRAVGGALRAGIDEFSQMQIVAAQSSAVLKSTGGVANVTAGDIQTLANRLSQLSGVDDEAIASAENLILTFKNVRNELGEGNQIFDRATLAALDLSKAAGGAFGDLPTTAKQLAKALNDPVRGMTALSRAGVTFSASQKEVIKRLVESGRVLEAQKIILREVESQVGGSARAYGETLPGQLAKLRESFRNTFGEIIAAAVPPLRTELLPVLQDAAKAIRQWAGDSQNQARIQNAVRQAIDLVTKAARAFRDVFNTISPIIQNFAKFVGGAEEAIKLLLTVMVVGKVAAFGGAITGLSTQMLAATGRAKALRTALLRLGALGVIVLGVELFIHRKTISDKAKEINRALNDFLPGGLFGGDTGIDIPLKVENLPKLIAARKELAGLTNDENVRVKVLDRIIARLNEISGKRIRATVEIDVHESRVMDFTPDVSKTGGKPPATDPKAGNAIIARITRQSSAQKSLNQELAESEKRAAHLRDLIREDPANLRLQQRLSDEIRKQVGLSNEIADSERERAENAREAARQARIARTERERERAENRRDAAKAAQFQALGLTAEGLKPTPGSGSLLKRALSMQERLKGTALDTKKNRSQLRTIVEFLKKNFKKAGKDVREAILQMLNDIAGAGDAAKTGPLTKGSGLNTKKILEGMGLSPEEIRELRGRLSSISSGGRQLAPRGSTTTTGGGPGLRQLPVVVESHVYIDGREVTSVVTRQQQKDRRRNPRQKRGPQRRGI